MVIKIEQSTVYEDKWFLKIAREGNSMVDLTVQLTKEEVDELINEARRIFKQIK